MPAPKGNKFNFKKPEERLNRRLHINCREDEYKAWKKKAGKKKMAAWAREKLNED